MANKIRTVMTYPLTGAVDFAITFEYLARKFVTVTLIGKDRKELVLNQDYRFTTKTQITTTRAWTAADGYYYIEIRRFTSATDRLVDFADGSILRAYDLNIAQIQTLHVAEEARDLTADTIGVNNDGHLDARGRRIVNLANAVDDGDAVSLGQLKTMDQNSWQARNEALQFRNEAETFRNKAEGFKNESSTHATNAKQWRNEAEGFRDEAEQFKNASGQYADAAGSYAGNAKDSEDEARRIAASIRAAGLFGYITRQSFEKGFNLTVWNEVLLWEEEGEYYRWDGTLPKNVPAGSTPESSGGIGLGAWVSVGDSSLRGDLAKDDGYKLIPSVQIQQWKDVGDIRGWGAVEGQDCTTALQAAINDRGALGWGAPSDVIINGNYRIDGQVILTTDVRIIGNWATIVSSSNDWIFVSGYRNSSGQVVNNFDGLTDDEAIFNTRLKGTVVKGITFVDVAKVFHLRAFTERCGLEDLAFERCGICWDTRLSFYPYYKNILIRGVKAGYEDWFAYQLRHQCNQVTFTKVTVSGRKYGELIDDDVEPTVMPTIGKNCQHINHIDCTYEGVTKAVVANIKTIGYTNKGIYAEAVSDNMFEFTTVEHYDVEIQPRWFAGVEKMGHFNNLRGNSKIWQGMQYDYIPAKRSTLQFGNSIVTVYPAQEMLSYEPISTMDSGIAFDGTSKVRMPRMRLTSDDVPVWDDNVNFARCPVTISGFIPYIEGKTIGVTGVSYDQITDVLTLSTDIYWSVSNLVLVALQIYQTSNIVNKFNSTGIVMNGFGSQFAGQSISYDNVGGLTVVKIAQPGGPSGSSWMASGDYTVEGCIRLL